MKTFVAILVTLGIVFLTLAFVYPYTVKTDSLWSEEQAAECIEISQAAHTVGHKHTHAPEHSDSIDKQTEETMDRFHHMQAQLDEARQRPHRTASILKWLGVASVILGAVLYYARRT